MLLRLRQKKKHEVVAKTADEEAITALAPPKAEEPAQQPEQDAVKAEAAPARSRTKKDPAVGRSLRLPTERFVKGKDDIIVSKALHDLDYSRP